MKEHKILYLEGWEGMTVQKAAGAFADLGMDLQKCVQNLKKWRNVHWKIEKKEIWKNWYRTCRLMMEGENGTEEIQKIEEEVKNALLDEQVKEFVQGVLKIVEEAAEHLKVPGKLLISTIEVANLLICGTFLKERNISKVAVTNLYGGERIDTVAAEILKEYGIKMKLLCHRESGIDFLGAAMAAYFIRKYGEDNRENLICGRILGIGMGTERDYEMQGVRGILLQTEWEEPHIKEKEEVWVLETNVDDCTGEQLGYTIERLMKAGAKDANAMPVYMKKNRPAYILQVICSEDKMRELEAVIFQETTSIGLRKYKTQREVLPRRFETVDTNWGEVRMKVCTYQEETYYYPEYEDVKVLSQKYHIPYYQIYQQAVEVARNEL